jgi:hypothetical protein
MVNKELYDLIAEYTEYRDELIYRDISEECILSYKEFVQYKMQHEQEQIIKQIQYAIENL